MVPLRSNSLFLILTVYLLTSKMITSTGAGTLAIAKFHEITSDVRIFDYTLDEKFYGTRSECAGECIRSCRCKRFAYSEEGSICQLPVIADHVTSSKWRIYQNEEYTKGSKSLRMY